MDLPTYTNIWRIEKRLYKLYDFRLPQPVSVVFLGVLLGTYAIWFALLAVIGVPFTTDPPWHVLWLVPPFVITFFATRPVMEGKRLSELVVSQVRYMAEARVYTSLSPEREPTEVRVAVRVWHRDPAAGPLPVIHKKTAHQRDTVRAAQGAPALAEIERPVERDRARTSVGGDAVNHGTPEAEPLPTPSAAGPAASVRPPRAAPPLALDTKRKQRREIEDDERPRAAEPIASPEPVESTERVEPIKEAEAARPPAPVHFTEESADRPAPKRGVGLRVLNYFGFALPKQDRPA
ncbi:TcpE family conjugal transfer membrane protein, partial [Nocardiopsis gilva]